ncbi:hypothetical protein BJ965_006375 [Streptomyces luteogriseus]|uniref:Uncharacterized protein n=1 Tax=Streptomyces luteogriseus TaxID=68233 RepID=A0A7W7GL42_9ACTN|nr:hypothetical protein [Streptomyces luteogriseus]
MTVREAVRLFARSYPLLRNPGEVIGLAGLEPKANGRIHALPGGRRRRLDAAPGVISGGQRLSLGETAVPRLVAGGCASAECGRLLFVGEPTVNRGADVQDVSAARLRQ